MRSAALAFFALPCAVISLVAAENTEDFWKLRARATELAATEPGRAYDEAFGTSNSLNEALKPALKACTENTERPYPVNIVFVLDADGRAANIVFPQDQPVTGCVVEKLKGFKGPSPPKANWLVALNIAISDPGPAKPPTEFVTQILEPTGGKLERPKDWFYTESHNSTSYTWTISREDASKARYETGMRIQMFVGIKKGTGKTPKKFIADFVAAKRKEAARIVSSCGESKQDFFTRVCLETEEGPCHILYSLFWADKLDWVVVTIAGTRKDLWDGYDSTFQRIGHFELIDLKRFQEKK